MSSLWFEPQMSVNIRPLLYGSCSFLARQDGNGFQGQGQVQRPPPSPCPGWGRPEAVWKPCHDHRFQGHPDPRLLLRVPHLPVVLRHPAALDQARGLQGHQGLPGPQGQGRDHLQADRQDLQGIRKSLILGFSRWHNGCHSCTGLLYSVVIYGLQYSSVWPFSFIFIRKVPNNWEFQLVNFLLLLAATISSNINYFRHWDIKLHRRWNLSIGPPPLKHVEYWTLVSWNLFSLFTNNLTNPSCQWDPYIFRYRLSSLKFPIQRLLLVLFFRSGECIPVGFVFHIVQVLERQHRQISLFL